LIPTVIGRTTLAACRSAFDQWVDAPGVDLTVYLREALTALANGCSEQNT
jgi:hypothetical protein